jgi:hypothetical protein
MVVARPYETRGKIGSDVARAKGAQGTSRDDSRTDLDVLEREHGRLGS